MDSSVKTTPDHYAVLGLSPEAMDWQVEEAFHARVREHLQYPDLADAHRRQKARQVSLAYETLRDPEKRSAYDASRGLAGGDEAHLKPEPEAPAAQAERPILFVPPTSGDQHVEEPRAAEVAPAVVPAAFDAGAEPSAVPLHDSGRADPIEPEPHALPAGEVDEPVIASGAARAVEPEPAMEAEEVAQPDDRWDIVPREPYDRVPAHDVYYDEPRPSGVHRAALGGGAAVIALGLLGLLMTRGGGGSNSADQRAASTPSAPVAAGAPAGQALQAPKGNVAPLSRQAAPAPVTSGEVARLEAARPVPPVKAAPSGDRLASLKIPPAPVAPISTPSSGTTAPSATNGTAGSGNAAATAGAAPANPPAAAQSAAAPPQAAAPAAPAPAPRRATFAHWLAGGLSNADNPGGMYQGTVTVRFTVQPNGRVTDCRPVASSGNGGLDASTCSLVQQRLRFTPAQDADGHPVPSEVRTTYKWGRMPRR